jgi:hypothetical protein
MTLSGIAMAAGEPDQREQAERMLDLPYRVGMFGRPGPHRWDAGP